jgi:hypothetical protein
VVRDASYLNWKYVDQPGQNFIRLEVSDARGLCGVAILVFRESTRHYPYRRAFLVDFVAPLSDGRSLSRVIQAASRVAFERGADSLVCLHTSPLVTRALRREGFLIRPPERFLLVHPGGLGESDRQLVLAADNWLLTQGDSDIDRPW